MISIINRLEKLLNEPLPGSTAHQMMSPAGRGDTEELIQTLLSPPRNSAVMIILYPDNDSLNMVMIKRPNYDGVHSGQVSFPGGKFEETDINYEATALRETFEEIGISTEKIKVIGVLSRIYIPPSNFLVYPYIGYCDETPLFTIDSEVDRVITAPVNVLLNDEIVKQGKFMAGGNLNFQINAPYFEIDNERVWGATACILSELKQIWRKL